METFRTIVMRTLRRQDWPTNGSALRRLKDVDYQINQKAALAARLAAVQENGIVAMIRSGMDCDCSQYRRVAHMPVPVSLDRFLRDEAKHEEWLDGPESTYFARPSEEPEDYRSRDLALEAYEDGHPSVVYLGNL